MKLRNVIFIIALIILADQALKVWIKTHYGFGHITNVLGQSWFELNFIENEGMAWGWKLGGEWGKMALTLFRLAAVIFGTWYLGKIVKQQYSKGFIICAALIYAGALGNLIDSMFYGLIFSESDAGLVATAFPPGGGYAGFLHGRVVDMLYFPIIKTEKFTFFSAIFNIADASISVGVITLLLFQKSFFKRHHEEEHPVVQTNTEVSDETQVS